MEDRKKDHIDLAIVSQTFKGDLDARFWYEPLLSGHPQKLEPFRFLGKQFRAPLWISSMTGGTPQARTINTNLARVCKEFGLGMGLGSCRAILKNDTFLEDFDLRGIIGDNQPFFANLGICQVEELVTQGKVQKITDLVNRLQADGLIVHINPMQEWFQPEGDRIQFPPIQTIKLLLEKVKFPVIVKEVGQGMGPASLLELLKLPLAAIEFAAFGGTNFAKLELQRNPNAPADLYGPLSLVGVDAESMVDAVNTISSQHPELLCKELIISGGIKTYLDGYYLVKKSELPAIYGQASSFLQYARNDYDQLFQFVQNQIKGLEMAFAYLQIRK